MTFEGGTAGEVAIQSPQIVPHLCLLGSQVGRLSARLVNGGHQINAIAIFDATLDEIELSGCEFSGAVQIRNTTVRDMANFRGTKFNGLLELSGDFGRCPACFEATLSAESVFTKMKFGGRLLGQGDPRRLAKDDLQDEFSAVRHLRIEAQKRRWNREEAKFFAEEQRVERELTSWTERPLEKLLSYAYDYASHYGASVTRAFGSFLAWNLCFALVFCASFLSWEANIGLGNGYVFGLNVDSVEVMKGNRFTPGAALALQNAVNPLALFSERSLVVVKDPMTFLLSLIQTLGSVALFALLLLALRGRFQRAGAGGAGGGPG